LFKKEAESVGAKEKKVERDKEKKGRVTLMRKSRLLQHIRFETQIVLLEKDTVM